MEGLDQSQSGAVDGEEGELLLVRDGESARQPVGEADGVLGQLVQ